MDYWKLNDYGWRVYATMKKAYIKAVSDYLPETIVTNEELLIDFPEWSVEKVTSKLGIQERHVVGKAESTSDMAVKAAKNLFSEHSITSSSIDFILLCTQSPDYFLPTTACIIQNKLGIPTSAGAIDFNLGCSGYTYGLAMAKSLVIADIAKNILLLTSETYTKYIHPKDKSNRAIFGDAATATLVSTDGFAEIGEFDLGTDGGGINKLIVRNGASKHPKTNSTDFIETSDSHSSNGNYLFMDGAGIFTFTLDMVPVMVENTLKKNSLISSQVDLYIFHQANQYMLEFLRKKLGIPTEKFYLCLSKYGNTVSSTIPIALKNAIVEGKASANQHLLLCGFGVGLSWGSCILKMV